MLEISHEIVQQIAEMDTKHSWAAELMRLPVEKADRAELLILRWIEKEVTDMFPRGLDAERIVTLSWLYMLEHKAFENWMDENSSNSISLPIIKSAKEAVHYGKKNIRFLNDNDIDYATQFLGFMEDGLMKPDIDKILYIINNPTYYDMDISSDVSNRWKYSQLKRLREIDAIEEQKQNEAIELMEKEDRDNFELKSRLRKSVRILDKAKEAPTYNILYNKAFSYATQIFLETPKFKDFSIALVDYMGEVICPFCSIIYVNCVHVLPHELPKNWRGESTNVLSGCKEETILRWYHDYKREQEKEESERKMKENIDELFSMVEKYRTSEEFLKLLDYISNCRCLGAYNAMLVQLQKPGCMFVFTAKKWRELYGRQPKPNAQNLITLVPFGPVQSMYDFSDTEPIPGKEWVVSETELMEEWDKSLIKTKGKISQDDMLHLIKNLPMYGVYLDDKLNAANTYCGYLMKYETADLNVFLNDSVFIKCKSKFIISVNKNQSDECMFVSICHELGHLFCGHQYYNRNKVRRPSLKQREFEAETVAWIVCKRHGVENPSEEYLAEYASDGIIPQISVDHVLKAVAEIENMLSHTIYAKKSLWYKEDDDHKEVVNAAYKEISQRKNEK